MSYYASFQPKRIMIHKPKGVEITEEILNKLNKEFPSNLIFSIYLEEDKNKWFADVASPISKDLNRRLFGPDIESVLILGDYIHSGTSSPISIHYGNDDSPWYIVAGAGTLTFISDKERSFKIFFENFLKFLDICAVKKLIKKISLNCPGLAYTFVTAKNRVERLGHWEEYQGVFFSSIDFVYTLSFAQKSFFQNVLAFLADNPKEEIEKNKNLSDRQIIDLAKEKNIFEKGVGL